jgi:hypothetical protein
VNAFAKPGGYLFALTYGKDADWVRNVLAAGHCTIRWRGADHKADEPRIIDAAAARPFYSRTAWAVAGRLFPADAWLVLKRS